MSGFCEPARNLTYTTEGNLVHLTWEAPENPGCFAFAVYRGSQQLVMSPATALDDYVEEGVYNYCVYACYMDCQSEYVCAEVEVSQCGPVQNLDYTLNDDLLCTLTWDAPEDPTGLIEYQVYMDGEQLVATKELAYAFNVIEGEHDIAVKAVFEGCERDAHIDVCVVGAVENLTYQMDGHNVILNWDAIEGVNQYEVYVDGVLMASVEANAYAFDAENGLIIVTIKAVAESCYVLDTSVEICLVDAASDLSFIAMDYGGMHFVWSNVADVEYYNVVYNGNATQVLPESAGATGFSFDPIVGDNTICVTVHSIYGCDSEPICMTKEVCAPVDGFDYSFNGNEVTVTWNGNTDSYALLINGTEWLTVEGNSYTTMVDEGLQIRVTPVYEDCLAMWATYWVTVTNVAPEIRFTDVREGLMATAWNAVEGAIAYNLYCDGELIAGNLTATTYNDTEMAINTQHCYAVQSVFEKGVSDLGEAACANYFAGVDENDGKVNIFPNPTSDKVTIECAGMTLIEVYSAEGKLVRRIKVEGDAYQLDGLENGVYTIRIQSGHDIFVRRIIKTH